MATSWHKQHVCYSSDWLFPTWMLVLMLFPFKLLHWYMLPLLLLLHHTPTSNLILQNHCLCVLFVSWSCYHLLHCQNLTPVPWHHYIYPLSWWGAKEHTKLNTCQHKPSANIQPKGVKNHLVVHKKTQLM